MKISPYKIYWLTLIPLSGIVTKKDVKAITGLSGHAVSGEISVSNASKEKALERMYHLRGKLTKRYLCVCYTDKQFGLRSYKQPVSSILTKKQLAETAII